MEETQRTVLAQDVKEILNQNRKILEINEKALDLMTEMCTKKYVVSPEGEIEIVKGLKEAISATGSML